MSNFLTLSDIDFKNKTVLLRADLNVPVQNGRVTDKSRLEAILPTLNELCAGGARIVILSHFGRPKGKRDLDFSLEPVARELGSIWKKPVSFAPDCIGPVAKNAISALSPCEAVVLENTRFYPQEEANDPNFSKLLAELGDVYVNDAFSTAHRAHASTVGLAMLLPSAAGRLMQAELEALTKALNNPERPLAAIVGGAKISSKLDLLQNLISKVNVLVLGGGMANTFLAAKGIDMGKSLSEPDMYETARTIMTEAKKLGCAILLPTDAVVASELKAGAEAKTVSVDYIPADKMMLDVGAKTIKEIKDSISKCKTIVWNGPMGAFEFPPFDTATNEIAKHIADLTKQGKILSVAGGGDTVAALANAGVSNGVSYLSMAGGAFLEWLEGKELPGITALMKKEI
ncbi:MAG: phosphoglycerate kinase [Alphaproteobacteria bacterium]|nr:phosphoglycerate kinase [Alphaproteobacteria bacterium]